jgi:small acid-soluble spore protein D (minor alpha/beta-type SASP)
MARNNNRILNPNARGAMDRLKMETANEVGVQLKEGYNGDIKSKDAGTVGGNMVRKMIQAYENKL